MLERRTVILAAYNKINGFARNIRPEHVRGRHAEEVVAAKRSIYQLFLQELNRELNDPETADELIYDATTADVFDRLMAEISAQHEALHDISRALLNSHTRVDPAHPTEDLPEEATTAVA